jgi:hypothetical protein
MKLCCVRPPSFGLRALAATSRRMKRKGYLRPFPISWKGCTPGVPVIALCSKSRARFPRAAATRTRSIRHVCNFVPPHGAKLWPNLPHYRPGPDEVIGALVVASLFTA